MSELEYKTVVMEAPSGIPAALAGPSAPTGIVDALVAVTGVKDDVDDIITPGAFAKTLLERMPKVCLGHDWNRPIGKTLTIKELMPGDPLLPKFTKDGDPWPPEAGALLARSQYNLDTEDGLRAWKDAEFFGTSETTFSIGYRVPPGGARHVKGVRHLDIIDLFEYSQVLHPAMKLASLQDIKAALDDVEAKTPYPQPKSPAEGSVPAVAEPSGARVAKAVTLADRLVASDDVDLSTLSLEDLNALDGELADRIKLLGKISEAHRKVKEQLDTTSAASEDPAVAAPDETGAPINQAPDVTPDVAAAAKVPVDHVEGQAAELIANPHRLINSSVDPAAETPETEASASAFGPVAETYSRVIAQATPEQVADARARATDRLKDSNTPANEAMTIALLIPAGPGRDAFLSDMRLAIRQYNTTLDRIARG